MLFLSWPRKSKATQPAFSLIELLVVVAIIAVLSAIAVPMYVSYTTRVKLETIINQVQAFNAQLMLQYQRTGSIDAQQTFFGVTINADDTNPANINVDGVAGLQFIRIPVDIVEEETSGIGDGVISIVTLSSDYNNLCQNGSICAINVGLLMSPNGTSQMTYCGTFVQGGHYTLDIPANDYPSICNCTNMESMANNLEFGNYTPSGTNGC